MKKNKIFISIASYRDPELVPTIKDCISKSNQPNNLVFAISREYNSEDGFDDLSEFKSQKNFKIIELPHSKSLGVCNARHKLQKLFDNEEYYFQLDSHHRFCKYWDKKLIKTLKDLQKSGSKKPLLSSYLPSYDPDVKGESKMDDVWRTYIDRFMPEGPIFIFPESISNWKKLKKPEKARFISGHCIFSFGNFAKEVPYDPHLYFHGEESSLAARAFTHGYDLFHIHRPFVWHHYNRPQSRRHWDDNSKWQKLNEQSFSRYRKLFGMDGLKPSNFQKYGFGKERSLLDYEMYAGIDFSSRKIHLNTLSRKPPPIEVGKSKITDSQYVSEFKYCIDLPKSMFSESDYDVWVMAFKDSSGEEMVRLDANKNEVSELLYSNPDDDFVRFWRKFSTKKLPSKWIVWPHSESKGWLNIIEGEVPVP